MIDSFYYSKDPGVVYLSVDYQEFRNKLRKALLVIEATYTTEINLPSDYTLKTKFVAFVGLKHQICRGA